MTSDEAGKLYERFGYALFRRCAAIVRDRAVAEDVLHDVFVRVLRYGDGYRGGSMLAWLSRIADRACLDRLGRDGARPPSGSAGEETAEAGAPGLPAPEASRLLAELLAVLPGHLGQVAILYYVDDMNQVEIARALDCSTMTVKRRLRALRARALEVTGSHTSWEVGDAKSRT